MKTGLHWTCVLLFTHIIMGCVEVDFIQRAESQSVELSCSLEQVKGRVSGLHLYRSTVAHHHMITVLSLMDDTGLRVSHDYGGRLEVTGGLDSSQVRVLLSPLRSTDTGRYVWEVTHRAQNSSDAELINDSDQQVIVLVNGTGRRCQCSSSYPLLLYVISAAAGTLVVTLIWLTAAECARARKPNKAPPPATIYEEMTAERQGPEASRKQQQQGAGRPQNNPAGSEGPSQHLEEAVYANPRNFYASPRRLAEWL